MEESRHSFAADHDACGVGLVAQLGGSPSHEIIERGLTALTRLSHRGGVDADGRSGDGAGLLTAIPHAFFRNQLRETGTDLPDVFGVGMAFVSCDDEAASGLIASAAASAGVEFLGRRLVPVDASVIGPRSLESLPGIQQFFFGCRHGRAGFETRLFQLRKRLESTVPKIYFCSLSSRTIIYKGLLTPQQLGIFYSDLADPNFVSSFAIFHQRYSTNTQPSWSLAQPFCYLAHNGEINTINSNRRWLRARQPELCLELGLPADMALLQGGMSDSASLDNAFEIQLRLGHSLPKAISRLVPPAWEHDHSLSPELRSFYESSAREQEPWDGPAALIFSDGETVGAKLDRNGLRPLRYTVTEDGLLVVASEAGVLDLHGKRVVERQRLGPGELLIADPANGILFRPGEVGELISRDARQVTTTVVPAGHGVELSPIDCNRLMAASGWTEDQFRMLFRPLVENSKEPLWSMGDDAPPAFLSNLPHPLWDYCKQRFAQVTNPAIDPLREAHVMSLEVYLGDDTAIASPLLDATQTDALAARFADKNRIDFTFEAAGGIDSAQRTIALIAEQARKAASNSQLVILSDRKLGATRAVLPALLAVSAAWKAIVDAAFYDVALIVETAQVIDTHHLALLVAVGASGVHPWLAMEMAERVALGGSLRYRRTIEGGLRKVLARMGIATIASYRNSHLFETIGLNADLCAQFFEDAGRKIEGKSLTSILSDYLQFHAAGFGTAAADFRDMGLYRFRHNGERHGNSPELVRRLHRYLKSPTAPNHAAYSELAHTREEVAIRDLLTFQSGEEVDIEEVETDVSLLSRLSTQAMSLGAISPEAHRTLAVAMNRLGGRSNTGEGGEDPSVYAEDLPANNRVKQVASGRFGVTTEYLVHADEIEIKMAQGAKPGEGGQLPSLKVSPYIARLRHAVPGTALISPPPHHDIYSIEDLAQLIYDLRAVNPQARIGVKLVSTSDVGIIAVGVAKAGADVITISGHDGGTGASPITSIKNTGMPWEIGLRDAHSSLVRAGLRTRVRLRVDGGLKFARDVVIAALLGAEEFGFGTAALLAIGCVMARQCHLNSCPVGIATQDEHLRARFAGQPEMVEAYFRTLVADVRRMLAELGAHSIDQIVGAVERLRPRSMAAEANLARLLQPVIDAPAQYSCPREDESDLHLQLKRLVEEFESLATRSHRFQISNADRAIGAHLSGQVLRKFGAANLAMNGLNCEFFGTAGQSFGAFLIPGATFRLTGEANDYVGKGLCGGTVSISAGPDAAERGDVLAGNAVLYGATAGELYIAGRAGERFAIRNSGALAVAEGVGQHGCEYMTAGIVVILGPTAINFGAGMTGGLAYVLRTSGCQDRNYESVRWATLSTTEERWLRKVLRRHVQLTGSPRAARLLSRATLPFLRVEPVQPPCSVEETWAPILSRLAGDELAFETVKVTGSEKPVIM
jgi:glutamate synthase domain-containing protein 2/glutamate synthase domain-containing protein 1/glutamate synthase domain-containing protein 3